MESHMDYDEEDTPEVQDHSEDNIPKLSSILKPGSMVIMKITIEDYEKEYWPKLENAINQLLTMTPGDYIPISYEQMYSCVYKCVCKQFSERLYSDLINYMKAYLECVSLRLESLTDRPLVYIEQFNTEMNQYIQGLSGIVPIFNYMNRFYVEHKLKTDLNAELRQLFTTLVAEKHVSRILSLIVQAQKDPFAVKPQTMSSIIKNTFSFNKAFGHLQPNLFSQYIPDMITPTQVDNIDKYIEEARLMQQELVEKHGFVRGDQSRKRPGEDDIRQQAAIGYYPRCQSSNHNMYS